MKKVSLLGISVFFVSVTFAQVAVRVDNAVMNTGGAGFPISGIYPTTNKQLIELVSGSPFFNTNWTKSKIVTESGKVYQDVPVKINLYESNIHYQDKGGAELVMDTPISEVLMDSDKAGQKVHFINGNILPNVKKGWYQLLVNDTITLIKGFRKTLETHTSYGSAKDYSIATIESYYVFYNGKEYDVKKASDLIDVLPIKKKEIEAQIKKTGKLSREEQLKEIVFFCNTLLQA